ncbi:MAG: alpha/beta hydrolase [Lapillicoccus sp.]
MAEDLRPEGIPVYVDNVVITTPGLSGRVEVHQGGTPGMRGAEDATEDFRRALEDAGMSEQLTVEISGQSELDANGGSRAGGGGDEITIEMPAPGDGNGQLLLYAAEDGSLSWHLPDSVPTDQVPTRGGERRTYRLPRAVVLADQEAAGGQRGILGAAGTKLFKLLVFPLIDPVLGKVGDYFAGRWEAKNRRNQVRWFAPDSYRLKDAPALGPDDWTTLHGGAALLFVHGTFAQAHTAYSALSPEVMAALHDRYDGRVFAVDHFTVSQTPHENVTWLAEQLAAGAPLVLDVVTHSRGGLVGRALAERAAELGFADRLTVRTLVMVASPNAGTVLADKDHLSAMLDRITDLVQFVPDNGVTDVIGIVLSVLKQLTIGAFGGLDGIMSMNPSGDYLRAFNETPGSTATYRAMASNYEPTKGSSLARVARDGTMDIVFAQAKNDLVVPTAGAYEVDGATGFPIADPYVFPDSAGVDHCGYFSRPEFGEQLLAWLPAKG